MKKVLIVFAIVLCFDGILGLPHGESCKKTVFQLFLIIKYCWERILCELMGEKKVKAMKETTSRNNCLKFKKDSTKIYLLTSVLKSDCAECRET